MKFWPKIKKNDILVKNQKLKFRWTQDYFRFSHFRDFWKSCTFYILHIFSFFQAWLFGTVFRKEKRSFEYHGILIIHLAKLPWIKTVQRENLKLTELKFLFNLCRFLANIWQKIQFLTKTQFFDHTFDSWPKFVFWLGCPKCWDKMYLRSYSYKKSPKL